MDMTEQGRAAFAASRWATAYDALAAADLDGGLDAADLELLATAAFLTGREEASTDAWARAHTAYLESGDPERAVGCAQWVAFGLVNRGELAQARGWMARAYKLLDDCDPDCVQRGFIVGLSGIQALWEGDAEAARASAQEAAALAEQHHDADLATLSGLLAGQLLVVEGR